MWFCFKTEVCCIWNKQKELGHTLNYPPPPPPWGPGYAGCPTNQFFLKADQALLNIQAHLCYSGPRWFRWQYGVQTPSDLSWDLTETHSPMHTQKQAYISAKTHIVSLCTGQSRAKALFWCKAFWEYCLPLFLFFFLLIALFTFPGRPQVTKSLSTMMTDVLDGTWVGLQDSLAAAARMNKVLCDL